MALSAIVALCLLALTSAAPQCSTSCDASSKMAYVAGTTYSYDYTGKHEISVDGEEEGFSTSEFSATVSVTALNACDVVFAITNSAGTSSDDILARQVEKYPFMVAYTNGKLEKVCSHPEDDVFSVDLKKAIASAFQNVLPTLEPTTEPQVYTEEDYVGICPTKYNVLVEGDDTAVTKEKIHSNCQEQFYTQTRSSFLPDATPLPIQYSKSSCIMKVNNGVYSSIRCKDIKSITPGAGTLMVVKTVAIIDFQLASDSADAIDISSLEEPVLKSQSVRYTQELPMKNPAVVPKVDAIMAEICTLSQGQGNKQVASMIAQVIELLRFVPDDAVVEVLDKIRAGQYCAEYAKLESLFLDAVAFVGEPGAFKVMAQEIAAGKATGGRFTLYTAAVNLLTKPTLNHVAALTPIFGMTESSQLLSLAASTVVNRYITQNADYTLDGPINEILLLLADKLNAQCDPAFSNVETTKVLTTLKSVGNIGIIQPDVFAGVMKCVTTEGIDTNVRFAAAMTFKGSSCLPLIFPEGMKKIYLDASMNTEVRIGAYLSAVKCASDDDFEELINTMSSEANEQVQGFIFSHLQNLQETNWPLKQILREKLASKTIPNDYMRNILKYSRNFEMSVNAPIIELGSLAESNVVYAPESYVPRLVNLGLDMNLLGSFINVAEVGIRVEELDPYFDDAFGSDSYLYKEVFGPNSYLYNTPLWSVIDDSKLFMTQRGTEMLQQIQTLIKENDINPDTIIKAVNTIIENSKNVDADSVMNAFNEVLKNVKNIPIDSAIRSVDFDSIIKSIMELSLQLPKTDLYAIIRAQERAFLSFGGKKNAYTINKLIETVIPVIMNAIGNPLNLNIDIARTGQFNIDYSIPVLTGMPLKRKLSVTGVAGLQLINNLNMKPDAVDALLKIVPSFSYQVEGQIGFGEMLNTGIKVRSKGYTTNGFALNVVQKNGEDLELLLELPEKMEFFDFDTEFYFMKLDKASSEVKIIPSYLDGSISASSDCLVRAFGLVCYDLESYGNMNDVRMKGSSCSNPISQILEPVTGLKLCYKMNIQDITRSKSYPIVEPIMLRFYLEKSDAAMKGYRLAAKLKNEPNNKVLKIVAGTYGTAEPKEATIELAYVKEDDTHMVATNFQSPLLVSTYAWTFINQPEYKSLQYYIKQDIGSGIAFGEGSVMVDFKPTAVDNGNTYEVATYAGLGKGLDEKNRLFQMMFSLLNGEKTAASFLVKTDLFPASFEAVVEIPSDQLYKIDSISLKSTVYDLQVESRLLTLSSGKPELKAETIVKHPMVELSASSYLGYDNGIVAYSSELNFYESKIVFVGGGINFDISAPGVEFKFEVPVAEMNCKVGYSNGVIEGNSKVKYFDADALAVNTKLSYVNYEIELTTAATFLNKDIFFGKIKQVIYGLPFNTQATIQVPEVFLVDFFNKFDLSGVTTALEVGVPALIKPLKVKNEFGITNTFSYSFLTDVTSGDSVVLHVEGPLTYVFSKALVQETLDLKISGVFDGEFKVNQNTILSLEKIQYTLDVSHTSTKIVSIDTALDRQVPTEINGYFNVNIPFVTDSELSAYISTSLIHLTMNTLVLPSTDYARRLKGAASLNWVENKFKGEFLWDAENDNDKRVELSTKYALDTTAFKFLVQGELIVTAVTYGYRLESVLASPFDFLQGRSFLEFAVTMPSEMTAVATASLDIAYADSQLTLTPLIAFNYPESQYELSSTVVAKKLPALLNFELTSETTLLTPQNMGDKIVLISKLLHEDKEGSGRIVLMNTLKESVLSQESSFEYMLEVAPSVIKETLKAQYGTNLVKLGCDIIVNSGWNDFIISHDINLPLEVLKSIVFKFTKTPGTNTLAFVINDVNIIKLYYRMPLLTEHIIGIEFPSRAIELNVRMASNQIIFNIYPAIKKNDKVVELVLRLTPKATSIQFESLLTAPSLTNEMRVAVDLELIEPGKQGYDMASIDVQYQVSEIPMFLKAVLQELQGIYEDLVNDGVFPDLNELYKYAQKLISQLPAVLNDIRDQVSVMAPQYYGALKNLVSNYYQLYEPDITALWNNLQSGLLMYWNIIKTEAPALINNYVEVITKTETWNVVQSILNEVMLNYPAYYAAVIDFYNTVIVPYMTDLSATVTKLLELSNIDFQAYWSIVINDVPELLVKYSQIALESQLVQELKNAYPEVFAIIADLYSKVVIPTTSDFIAFIQKVATLPLDFQIYSTTIQTEVPALATQFGQRLLDTQLVQTLKANFPIVFAVLEDFYNKVILPTFADILEFIQKLISLPILDFQQSLEQYWNFIKVEVPTLYNLFVARLPIAEIMGELKNIFPTVFVVAEDFYNTVILPTTDDVVSVVDKFVAVPIADIQAAFTMYMDIVIVEVPTLMSKFVQRIPDTQLMNLLQTNFAQFSSFLEIKFNELKEQYPELYAIALDFYGKVIVPAVSDLPMLYNKIIAVTDIYQLRDFVVMDVLSFVNNLLKNISTTDLFSKLMAVFDMVVAAYPEEYDMIVKTYKQVADVTVGDILTATNSYLFEKFGMSFSISAEKLTAVVPLPVSIDTVRSYYELVTVFGPIYLVEAFNQYVDQGRILYQYITSQVPVVMEYVNTVGPVYLQYIKDTVLQLQVVIPQFYNDIQAALPLYIDQGQAYIYPYVEEIRAMIETSYSVARKSPYGQLAEETVRNIIELGLNKANEMIERYPNEIQALNDFIILYMNICMDYTTWIINTIFEHPTVQKIIGYIATLTPEKAQADLAPVLDFIMTILRQVESKVNELLAAIPDDIPAFIRLHAPYFGIFGNLM